MDFIRSEQIYALLSLIFGLLSIISLVYLMTMFPKPSDLIAILKATPEAVVKLFHTFTILGYTTTILSIINKEKSSWIKVMGISINTLTLLFNIAGLILYLIFR